MKKLTALLLLLVMLFSTAIPAAADSGAPNGEKIVYGTSGEGRELCAYRYGNGKNVLIMGFAIHGFEDNFNQDGFCLVYTAELIMKYLSTSLLPQAHDWSVYILPLMNPDGLYSGWTNNGPGRCTTTMLDENGNLVHGTGIDMNRCFPPFSINWASRHYTSTRPMACLEAQALAAFVEGVKGPGVNVLIDTHGWLSQNITTSTRISQVLQTYFPYNYNTWNNGGYGYLINFAHNLGYETALLELPYDVYSLEQYKQSGYAERMVNIVIDLMKTESSICDKEGHRMELIQVPVSCTQNGESGSRCRVCGYSTVSVTTAPGHMVKTSSVVKVSDPTATQVGLYSYTCVNCGQSGLIGSTPSIFTDVASDAFYAQALDFCYARGIINGVVPGVFGGSLTLSRGMLVTMLYRHEGLPKVASVSGFQDVSRQDYYFDAVNWAVANGIINGIDPKTFAPNDPVTREQAVAIFHRYVLSKGLDNRKRTSLTFADTDQIQDYAKDAASWAVSNGVINGMDGNVFAPQQAANRAQSVAMLYRVAMHTTAAIK